MLQKTHADSKTLGDVFSSLSDLAHFKAIGSAMAVGFAWVFEGNQQILISIYALILVDNISGMWLAAKNKEFSSRGLYRTVVKCFVYFMMIVVGRIVDKHAPLGIAIAAPIMDSFLVMTEAFSILENFSKLGFPVPIKLLKILKIYSEKNDEK